MNTKTRRINKKY